MATSVNMYNHSSFGLGNIAQPNVISLIDKINACESKIKISQDRLDGAVMFRRSLKMTTTELSDMGIDLSAISERIKQVDSMISKAASEYINAKIENEETINKFKEELSAIPAIQMPESPIDMDKSKITTSPLFSESLQLDSQYFSFSSNLEEDKLANVEKFIRSSTRNIAPKSDTLSQSVCSQISNQIENHHICGTLIITASCTHRNASMFTPLIIDPDKAIHAWNSLKEDKIDISDLPGMQQTLSDSQGEHLSLITGASYGSSFVGMIHMIRTEVTKIDDLNKLKSQLELKLKTGGWLANATGELRIDRSILDDVKAFLSTNSISCHISIVAMGAIPTIKSNELTISASKLAKISEDNQKGLFETTESDTASSEAELTRQRGLLNSLQNSRIKSILSAVEAADEEKNKVLDINSLVGAIDNYMSEIKEKDKATGVPINFFFRNLTKREIIRLWLNKYYPEFK